MVLLGMLQPTQGAIDLVFGVLTDAAGVEEDGVGLLGRIDELVTLLAQRGHDELAIEHVHLTADGFNVEGLGVHDPFVLVLERRAIEPEHGRGDVPHRVPTVSSPLRATCRYDGSSRLACCWACFSLRNCESSSFLRATISRTSELTAMNAATASRIPSQVLIGHLRVPVL